jgi:hypothetical protein
MMASPSTRRPSYSDLRSAIFDLSLGEMLWSRRSAFLGLLVGGPVMLALISRIVWMMVPGESFRINGESVSGAGTFGLMIWLLYVRFIVPILGVFYGTALIADEVDDRTITYLFTRPIPRGAVLAGKYLAYLACTVLLILPSVVIVFFLMVPMGEAGLPRRFRRCLATWACSPQALRRTGQSSRGLVPGSGGRWWPASCSSWAGSRGSCCFLAT